MRGRTARKSLAGVRSGEAPPVELNVDNAAAHFEDIDEATKAAMDVGADKANEFTKKADRQLSRVEFTAAIIKLAVERYVKTRTTPNNEMDDVSDALDKVFNEHIVPTLFDALPGKEHPRLPLPDVYRTYVSYTQSMSNVLKQNAPSLRVLFAGLAEAIV